MCDRRGALGGVSIRHGAQPLEIGNNGTLGWFGGHHVITRPFLSLCQPDWLSLQRAQRYNKLLAWNRAKRTMSALSLSLFLIKGKS